MSPVCAAGHSAGVAATHAMEVSDSEAEAERPEPSVRQRRKALARIAASAADIGQDDIAAQAEAQLEALGTTGPTPPAARTVFVAAAKAADAAVRERDEAKSHVDALEMQLAEARAHLQDTVASAQQAMLRRQQALRKLNDTELGDAEPPAKAAVQQAASVLLDAAPSLSPDQASALQAAVDTLVRAVACASAGAAAPQQPQNSDARGGNVTPTDSAAPWQRATRR
eukprot:8241057-Alexandrium_andersonii.AAC.1